MFSIKKKLYCFINGLLTGYAAGLIGVGGGEFRLPFLVWLYKERVKTAAAVNLIIGSLTVIISLIFRLKYFKYNNFSIIIITLIFFIFSTIGSYYGVKFSNTLKSKFIKRFIILYIFAVGIHMITEGAILKKSIINISLNLYLLYFLAAILGFIISAISVTIGVAGGEMRIPTLIYIFGFDIKTAGTISLFASLPTVTTGAFKYNSLGYIDRKDFIIALIMGIGSIIGIVSGVYFLNVFRPNTLKVILGIILLMAAISLSIKFNEK